MGNYIGSDEHKENAKIASLKGVDKLKQIKEEKIKQYLLTPKLCKQCGKILQYEEKHKTFCNQSCSASFTNKGKVKSEDEKKRISYTLKLRYINKGSDVIYPKKDEIAHKKAITLKTKVCEYCGSEYTPTKNKQRYCSKSCGLKNRKLSEQTKDKLRNRVKERIKNGTFSGWKTRIKLKRSYAEKYFEGLFKNENIINWEPEYPCGKYFIDFAFINKKIALEIDGKQHEYPERKKLDNEKDCFLIENNWIVFRIKWYNPINEKNKKLLYNQINIFLDVLKNNPIICNDDKSA